MIREATASDIDGIAFVHATSWKTTYRGLISDEFLDKITVEARRKLWIRNFETPNKDEVMYVAEDEAGTIIGFANGGARRGKISQISMMRSYMHSICLRNSKERVLEGNS